MLSVSQIAKRLELPEERVAQIVQMVKTQGMDEAQMGSMARMATSKGLSAQEIAETMSGFGLPKDSILRVLRSCGAVNDENYAEIEGVLNQDALNQGALNRGALNTSDFSASGAAAKCGTLPNNAPPSNVAPADLRHTRWVEYAKKAGVILFWLVVWELLDRIVDNRLLLAGPIRTLQALAEQIVKSDFWLICAASFGRIALGFFIALAVGFILAMLSYRFSVVRRFTDPIISLLKTIPMASFIILLLIWVGTQALTIYLAFLIVVPIIYTNVLTGFESVDPQMLEMAKVHKLSKWRTFVYIYRPAFMPFLYSSCKLSLGMSWKAGIMAEVLAVPAMSIGKEMYTARTFLDTPDLLAWTVVVMILSLVFEKAVLWALGRAQRPCGGALGAKEASQANAVALEPSATSPAQLSIRSLSKTYGENEVLREVNFELEPSEACCLMAPSGSGKTTLFRVMLGLETPDAGSISDVARGNVGVMFQEDRLCEVLSPVENVALLLPKNTSRASIAKYLAEILPKECLSQPANELSGGMRRRVSLARAVAAKGSLVVLDEPFTGLDSETRRKVIDFIVRHLAGRTLLVATHGEDDATLLHACRVDLSQINDAAESGGETEPTSTTEPTREAK